MCEMVLIVPGATDEELQAGLKAARLFLESHDVTPTDAAAVEYAHGCWDDGGVEEDEEPSADAQHISRPSPDGGDEQGLRELAQVAPKAPQK